MSCPLHKKNIINDININIYEINEVHRAHDPYRNKKVNQEVLSMQTYK